MFWDLKITKPFGIADVAIYVLVVSWYLFMLRKDLGEPFSKSKVPYLVTIAGLLVIAFLACVP